MTYRVRDGWPHRLAAFHPLLKEFVMLKSWFMDRLFYWLVCWVFLADVLLEIATLGVLDLDPWVERSHRWLEEREERS